ncbi:MAG: threonine synthase [Rhodospirillales bacterium]
MKYVSTRGDAPELSFDDVLLAGLATDGGLYVPDAWPTMPDGISGGWLKPFAGMKYEEAAFKVMRPFVVGAIADEDLLDIIETAYASFETPDVAPLVELSGGVHLLELFHGPTLAFKDVAMQFLGRAFDHVLAERDEKVVIVGATSGDTGSAAIEAMRDKSNIDIVMLHPENRTSEVQRRQMTTVLSPNVHNVAVRGTFDDCQALVKAMFNDAPFRKRHNLSAVNSINWARVMAQVVYYVTSAAKLGAPDRDVAFCVPTGNFGNVFAAYVARRIGVPISQLIVASNRNDILTRFFETGSMTTGEVFTTLSPSMDIQVSSNFERLLFELLDRDGAATAETMRRFAETGRYDVAEPVLKRALQQFDGARCDDEETSRMIKLAHDEHGMLIDPHTAVGLKAVHEKRRDPSVPMVVAATAHPAKFADAVEAATGETPKLPERLADLLTRDERFTVLDNELGAIESFIDERLG